jgi:hypothetical protein
MAKTSLSSNTEELVRCTRQLKRQMKAFERSAKDVAGPLDEIVSDEEAAAMATPRANILGTLENLLNQEIGSFLRQLEELHGNLKSESQGAARAARSSPVVAAKSVRLRRAEP